MTVAGEHRLKDPLVSRPGRLSEPRGWVRFVEWMLLVLLATQIGVRSLPKAWLRLNTDFPNYYLTAGLVHERYDTSRVYDWLWLQRQKDHRGIDQRLVGMVPITPFSTLVIYPLTSLPALTAKRCWLVLNIALLIATLSILRRLTGLSWRRVSLVVLLSYPLRINFLLGQYYVLLLFLLTLACWLYLFQRRFFAGVIVGFATGLKIFPMFYLIYFLRKKDLRAFAGGVLGTISTAVISIYAFGWELHRTYLLQILPSALRGEGLDPYNLQSASLSSLLHKLFIFEPQLNQHPALNAPWLFATLHPLLQMMLIAPALLLASPNGASPRRIRLEWAAIAIVSLTLSTSSASYLFTILILPACLIESELLKDKSNWLAAIFLFLYVTAGFVGGTSHAGEGWSALLAVPRLYAMILLCVFAYATLIRKESGGGARRDHFAWPVALTVILIVSIASNLHHLRGLYADYQYRIPAPKEIFMAVHPVVEKDAVLFVAMQHDGYHSAVQRLNTLDLSVTSNDDMLGVAAVNGTQWIEQTGYQSKIFSTSDAPTIIQQAESPMASLDGQRLAFLREDHGRTRIWTHVLDQSVASDKPLTPPELNVLEMSFFPGGDLIFSATSGGPPGLFVASRTGETRSLDMGETRFPSVSPNGHWLAFSQLQGGSWNLWMRDLSNGQTRRLTDAACNSTEPAWTADSQTLVYASDCGRALWFSALCKRRIIY